jgi:purine nucleosidase
MIFMKKKLIIDTDCGSDDAMAIAMALRDPGCEILFFTTVSGNVILDQAIANTLCTIEMSGTYEPPVYKGCREMLLRNLVFAHETHGKDGLGDMGFKPERLTLAPGNAVIKMIETLNAHDQGEIELVTLGPLTNAALAIRLDPQAMRRVKRITVMGSAGLGAGNMSPVAEFNIWQDAEAARIVLESGLPLFFVGWDACLGEAALEAGDINRIRESGPLGRFLIDCNRIILDMNIRRFGRPCLDMADPAAVAAALYPDCIAQADPYYCEADTSAGPSYGAVLVDRYNFSGKAPNAVICSRLKPDKYKDYIFRTIGA